ncbi:hypothetical protein BDZ85DRAFT_283467 [Elsinoe ampelina]|uniref:Helicase C-terminal domain-containing protein n=1 Tax=Elsinoe ampelina TaxID=302913 RepID=A0A6A6G6L7_9PEZI|nr:hypothetical protein BDZ85DRAFT_283467 [Elsinoe ampelina]
MELEDVDNQHRQDGDSADTQDDTRTGRTLPPDLMVVRDHQSREHVVPVARFFGSGWDEIIVRETIASGRSTRPLRLAITLRSDQQNGIRRLLHLLDTPFKGAIVGHAIGCGCMTQAIIASRLDSNRAGESTLVITNSYQLEQCKVDIEEMFEPGNRPSIEVVKSSQDIEASELLGGGFDIVITTFSAVVADYRHLMSLWRILDNLDENDSDDNDPSGAERVYQKICKLTFFSPLYDQSWARFKHVIVDQAACSQAQGQFRKALALMQRSATILLTSNLLDNKWYKSRSLVQAIGGHPFTTSEEYHRVFGRAQDRQSDTQRQYLTRLLMALVVASPSSALPLPHLSVHAVRFELPREQEIQAAFVIIRYYRCLRVRLQQEGVSGKLEDIINETDEKDTASDIKMIATAQSLAGHLAQVDSTQVDHEEMKVSVEGFLSQCRTALNSPPDQLPGYKQCKDWLAKVVRGSNIYDDLLPHSARNTAESYDDKTPKSVKDTQSDDRWRMRLNAIDSVTLGEGRIGRTLDILRDLRDHTAGNLVDFSRYGVTRPVPTHHNKILIAGRYERFLTLLARAIKNFLPDIRLIIYDRVSEKTRSTNRHAFSYSRAEQTVMLITGNTHGANLKLIDATAVMRTEPWLVHDEEIEAWSRCHRTGQSRDVTVFQLMAENSMVDLFVADAQDEKDKNLQQYMRYLRPDGTPLDVLLGELRG